MRDICIVIIIIVVGKIEYEGTKALAEALKVNKTITEFNICDIYKQHK